MSPVEQAARVYAIEACARTFREDLEAHLLHGWVFSAPDYFAMGRPVDSTARAALVVDPWVRFDAPDCWHVYLCAGDFRKALGFIPYPLPLISFERRNQLRTYDFSRFVESTLQS